MLPSHGLEFTGRLLGLKKYESIHQTQPASTVMILRQSDMKISRNYTVPARAIA